MSGYFSQEIEPHVASELCRLFPMDTTTDWNTVLKRSKEAARKVNHSKVIAPIGSNSAVGSRSAPRGTGFRDRRDSRGRFAYFRNGRSTYGRYMSGLLFQMNAVSEVKELLCELI